MTISINRFDGETNSLEMLETLTEDLNITTPDVDFDSLDLNIPDALMDQIITGNYNCELDSLALNDLEDDTATFNRLINTTTSHLRREAEEGRITSAEYTTAYTQLIGMCMQNAVQYELNRYQSGIGALSAQINAIASVARYKAEIVRAKADISIALAQLGMSKAQYASQAMSLCVQDAQYGLTQQNAKNAEAQYSQIVSQTDLIDEQVNTQTAQTANVSKDTLLKQQQITSSMAEVTRQDNLAQSQIAVNSESITASQANTTRANSLNTSQIAVNTESISASQARTDREDDLATSQIAVNTQQISKSQADVTRENQLATSQVAVNTQQISSFALRDKRDCAKMWQDVWVTAKGVDDGTSFPTSMSLDNISSIMSGLRTAHNL